MIYRMLVLAVLTCSVFLAGCGSAATTRPDAVDVTVTVLLPDGKPAGNVAVNVFPTTTDQIQGGGKTDAAGKLKAKLMPGPHTFAIEGSAPAIRTVPKKYLANSADNRIEVPAGGGDISVKLSAG